MYIPVGDEKAVEENVDLKTPVTKYRFKFTCAPQGVFVLGQRYSLPRGEHKHHPNWTRGKGALMISRKHNRHKQVIVLAITSTPSKAEY